MIVYEVHVDWDAVNWLNVPDFTDGIDDITAYVKNKFYIDGGKKVELGNSPAGTLDLILNNADKRFSPVYAASPLYGKMRPWLPVRVQGTVTGGAAIVIYTGYISRISCNPHLDIQEAYLYCTDGLDLMARNMVTVDQGQRTEMSAGDAVGHVLDAAGWSTSKRSIDTDGGNILNYPNVSEN